MQTESGSAELSSLQLLPPLPPPPEIRYLYLRRSRGKKSSWPQKGKKARIKRDTHQGNYPSVFFVPSPVQKRTRSRQQHVVKMPSRSPGVPPQTTTSLLILSFVSLFVAASSSGHKGERETSAVRATNSLFFFRISNFSASREEEGWRWWGLPPPVFLLLLLG